MLDESIDILAVKHEKLSPSVSSCVPVHTENRCVRERKFKTLLLLLLLLSQLLMLPDPCIESSHAKIVFQFSYTHYFISHYFSYIIIILSLWLLFLSMIILFTTRKIEYGASLLDCNQLQSPRNDSCFTKCPEKIQFIHVSRPITSRVIHFDDQGRRIKLCQSAPTAIRWLLRNAREYMNI